MLNGLIMDRPLLISHLIQYADLYHGDVEIVTRTVEGPIHRYTYRDAHARAKRLANALTGLGINRGDRIGTLAWNTYRHFECYFGISGLGAVCHTINPRLFPDQIAWIMNHAEDQVLFLDLSFVGLVEGIQDQLTTVKAFVIMTDRANMPDTKLRDVHCYEELLAAASPVLEWPEFDEKTASSLCYTSGTTGNPKGVLYSHRSTLLHAYGAALPDSFSLGSRDAVLPVVPMFHANAWAIPYSCCAVGAKLVMPGAKMDGESIFELLDGEGVTFTAGVPTVWLGLLNYLDEVGKKLTKLEKAVIGGSAAPKAMIEKFDVDHGVEVLHAWGMTEMSPIGTIGQLKSSMVDLPKDEQYAIRAKQGRALFGVDMKITDDDGNELPRDGVAFGRLKVRGYWISSGYFKLDGSDAHGDDGWFDTGDVATLDPDGYMQITDRSKDVIKSGGEWISSIDLENIAVGHPAVAEAAAIGVRHPKWDERPLLVVVKKPGQEITKEEMIAFFQDKVAKWWIPDDVAFVEELPHTATGKLLKTKLRDEFKEYKLPGAA